MTANQSTFGQLTLGQKYTLVNGDDTVTVWEKIKPQTKGCCRNKKIVANTRDSLDVAKTSIHRPADVVCLIA